MKSAEAKGFQPILIPAQQAFASLGIGNTKGYELIAEGKLTARKLGTRTMVEAASRDAYANSLPKLPTKFDYPAQPTPDWARVAEVLCGQGWSHSNSVFPASPLFGSLKEPRRCATKTLML